MHYEQNTHYVTTTKLGAQTKVCPLVMYVQLTAGPAYQHHNFLNFLSLLHFIHHKNYLKY